MSKQADTRGWQRRREDYPLITGQAHYVDDLKSPPGRPPVLSMVVVRSPYAHAEIRSIQRQQAQSLPGVLAVLTGAELVRGMPTLDTIPLPGLRKPPRRPMAVDRVRYVGDPVAVVVAENLYTAIDARELVEVDYEPLAAITDPEAALEPGAPLLYAEFDSNIAFTQTSSWGDIQAAFADADRVVRLRVVQQRLAPSSLEPRACLFDFDRSTGELCARVSSQAIFRVRETLATFLGIDRGHIRVRNAEVGGAFGAKNNLLGEEIVAASLAVKFGRPVKWIEGRNENLQAQSQGRGQIHYIEAAYRHDGKLLGLKLSSIADLGAFLAFATAMVPGRVPAMLCGPYQVQAIESKVVGVFTNKATTAPYRGAGRPEAAYILERTLDRIAHELHLDPAEVRRRNFIPPQDFPHTTVTGLTYDSGNYQAALDRALELGDYAGWRAKQRAYREGCGSKLLGLGLATFIELSGDAAARLSGAPREAATVRICRDGSVVVDSGVSHNGQGHFTAFAHIAASALNLPASRVEVRMNDTALSGFSMGSYGSRIAQVAGSAVLLAAQAVRDKFLQLAAQVLEAAPADLVLEAGRVVVQGVPTRVIELGELARLVEEQPGLIEREAPNPANGTAISGLAAWRDFSPAGATYSSGAHLAVVEVDSETGEVNVLQYVAVDDCGRVLNASLAEAQIHGSLAQGISQALYEEVVYDQESQDTRDTRGTRDTSGTGGTGQLLSGTLLDYTLPLATQLPDFVTEFIETPSPYNPLGAKGVGEAGCIGGPAAIVNAVLDALAPYDIETLDMSLRPEKLWSRQQRD